MGGYERDPAPWALDGIPADFNGKLLAEDWERFEPLMTNALVRVPMLEDAEVVRLINGPEAFTPDGEFILGPSDVRGFWVAAGFCAHGLAGAGGMGRLVAEWIVRGHPSLDVWHMDSRRFGRHYASREFTLARTTEIYSTYYDVRYPGRSGSPPARCGSLRPTRGWQSSAPRSARRACGSGRTGSSRTPPPGDEALRPRGWAGRIWSPAIGAEHRACRETPALFDETSFAKIEVCRRGAAGSSSARANRVAREVGALTYTQLLNDGGGVECDLTVTRLADDRFRSSRAPPSGSTTSPGSAIPRARRRIGAGRGRHLPYACLGLWGPRPGEILQPLTDRSRQRPSRTCARASWRSARSPASPCG